MQHKAVYLLFCKFTLHVSSQPRTSSGVHKIVTTVSGNGYIFCAATSLQTTLATLEGGRCTLPEAVVTVLCTPDNECG